MEAVNVVFNSLAEVLLVDVVGLKASSVAVRDRIPSFSDFRSIRMRP